ncbi:DedA family protein [Kordiimonas gwangyangensis]|uniref:DedA family protein n=1 Tax=Kordiimonas gwangyangensis TaxID=288022 RepID=UPI000365D48F|nr:VTT domain-containing protein [Kordiimonas gwangyangensis]
MGNSPQEWLDIVQGLANDPVAILAAIALLSLVADSAAVIVAGLLVAQGVIPLAITAAVLPLALLAGDCAIYIVGYLARENEWLERHIPQTKVKALHGWLEPRQLPVLAVARLLPGSRSVIFLGFGYFRLPPAKFAVANAISGTVWSWILMGMVVASAEYFATEGAGASFIAGIGAAAVLLVPAYFLAMRSKYYPPRKP